MSERDDLDNLLKSPGWQTLVNAEREWWRENLSALAAKCANNTDDVAALNQLRQVCAAKDAVERFIAKPEERLRALNGKERVAGAVGLLSEFDRTMRRGGL